MRRRAVWFTSEASLRFHSMAPHEQVRWAARIDRIAAGRPYRATRKVRGARDLYRLAADGSVLLYRATARGRSLVIVALARGRTERIIEAVLGGGADR